MQSERNWELQLDSHHATTIHIQPQLQSKYYSQPTPNINHQDMILSWSPTTVEVLFWNYNLNTSIDCNYGIFANNNYVASDQQWFSITFKLQFTTTILPNLTDRVFNYNSTTSHNNDYITSHNCNNITITDYSQIALLNHTSTAVIAIRLCYS